MKYLFVVLLAVLCCLPGKAQQKKYKAYFVADAHLDTQWNWDLQTTISEYFIHWSRIYFCSSVSLIMFLISKEG